MLQLVSVRADGASQATRKAGAVRRAAAPLIAVRFNRLLGFRLRLRRSRHRWGNGRAPAWSRLCGRQCGFRRLRHRIGAVSPARLVGPCGSSLPPHGRAVHSFTDRSIGFLASILYLRGSTATTKLNVRLFWQQMQGVERRISEHEVLFELAYPPLAEAQVRSSRGAEHCFLLPLEATRPGHCDPFGRCAASSGRSQH